MITNMIDMNKIWIIDKSESIIANCISLPHDENEMIRRKHDDTYFTYDWKV